MATSRHECEDDSRSRPMSAFFAPGTSVEEMLAHTNLKLRMAEFNLKRLVDTGEYHHVLSPGVSNEIELFSTVPCTFKVALAEIEMPAVVRFAYEKRDDKEKKNAFMM